MAIWTRASHRLKASVTNGGKMQQQPSKNNVQNLLSDLKSCSKNRDLQEGRRVHTNAVETGNDSNMYVAAALVNMYAKCGSMVDSQQVFDRIDKPNVVSWTSLIMGYADNGQGQAALDLFSRMKAARKCLPNSKTYVAAIKACTSLAANANEAEKGERLKRGKEIHSEIGPHMDHFLQSTLINLYATCGSMVDAQQVFDLIQEPDVVSWNALIMGYADNGQGDVALALFSNMKAARVCVPDSVTYVAAIKACTSLASAGDEAGKGMCLQQGKKIHLEIGHHRSHFVQSTLINLYAKCSSMVDAHRVFDKIQEPDVVSWNALILGYADNGQGQTALDLFSRMKSARGCVPDLKTYVAVLKACGSIGALAIGRIIHTEITKFDAHVVTSLVDFYSKCGSMVEAREVFDSHSSVRNITTWTALLAGYASFGDSGAVFNLFEAMQDQNLQPNAVTFVCMLLCCSHAGLVEKAREYFEAMPVMYGVTPSLMHYNCMIDVLGRANQLDEALALIRKLPYSPDPVTWMALLGACRKWKNVEIGRVAFQSLVSLDQKIAAAYVLMAQIYGSRGMWQEQERVLETRKKFGAWKLGQSYVMDGRGRLIKFVVGEEDPPEIQDKMKQFLEGMKLEHGYVAEHNVGDEEALCGHSERRAVVYGILKTPIGEPIRAYKNMRMCDDCHWSTKMFSKFSKRVIMVRDERRFHVMENGICSCGDYW